MKSHVTEKTPNYRIPDPEPCEKCGKPDTHGHQRWCGIPTTRAFYAKRIRDGRCLNCLSIVLNPEAGCLRCKGVEETAKENAAVFFAAKAAEKKAAKLEAAILADEAADLI